MYGDFIFDADETTSHSIGSLSATEDWLIAEYVVKKSVIGYILKLYTERIVMEIFSGNVRWL